MAYYATRYEVRASKGEEGFTVGYTARRSRAGLLVVMQRSGEEIIKRCNVGTKDEMRFGFRGQAPQRLAYAEVAGWKIGFTGRTERETR